MIEINKTVREVLDRLGKLETSQVNMFHADDKYLKPPYFRFRFAGKDKEDILYKSIIETVNNYEGCVKWVVTTNSQIKNYLIVPALFEKYLYNDVPFKKEFIAQNFADDEYHLLIDNAIKDIPGLANALERLTGTL